MARSKQASQRKGRRRTLPLAGAAGMSLAFAGGAYARRTDEPLGRGFRHAATQFNVLCNYKPSFTDPGQVQELLDILTWAASFEGFALRPTMASYS